MQHGIARRSLDCRLLLVSVERFVEFLYRSEINMRRTLVRAVVAGVVTVIAAQSAPSVEAATLCAVTDVTFDGDNADQCAGGFDLNGNPQFADVSGLFGGNWNSDGAKDESGGNDTSSFLGLLWTIQADIGDTGDPIPGSWSLTVSDPNPGVPQDFPVTVDLMAVLKGSTEYAVYLFTAEQFLGDGTTNGTFKMIATNRNGGIQELSNMQVFLRQNTTVPEPTTLSLLGFGVAAAGLARRRRNA